MTRRVTPDTAGCGETNLSTSTGTQDPTLRKAIAELMASFPKRFIYPRWCLMAFDAPAAVPGVACSRMFRKPIEGDAVWRDERHQPSNENPSRARRQPRGRGAGRNRPLSGWRRLRAKRALAAKLSVLPSRLPRHGTISSSSRYAPFDLPRTRSCSRNIRVYPIVTWQRMRAPKYWRDWGT
jgi:hypothetical protein